MYMRLLVLLGAALFLGGGVASGNEELRDGETVEEDPWSYYPGTGPLDEKGEEIYWCVRIVDAVDGKPISGARVSVPEHPGGGVPESQTCFLAEAVTDWEGWTRISYVAVRGWMDYSFGDAPGYAVNEYCNPGKVECRLERGVDVPVVVVDYVGRPVPNARIALNLGCGHVPDQRTSVADGAGRAVLHDILPSRYGDIWIEASGCQRGTARLRRTWREGDPPVAIDAVPGIAVSGRLLAPDGAAVAHALVGASELHRPWTQTDREGRFRLVGVSRWEDIAFILPPVLGGTEGSFVAPPEGVERVLVVGHSEPTMAVSVCVRGPEGEQAGGVRVAMVRDGDGLVATDHADEKGMVRLAAPAGRYRVLVDGELGAWGAAEAAVSVPAEGGVEFEVTVPRNPTVTVDATRVIDLNVGLTTPYGFRRLTWDEGDDPAALVVPIPRQGPAAFRISGREGGELIVTHVDASAPGSSVALDWSPVTRLTARLVGPDGAPVAGLLEVGRSRVLDWPCQLDAEEIARASPEPLAESRLVGTVAWTVTSADPSLFPANGDVRLLPAGGTIDLGEIRLERRVAPDVHVDLPTDLTLGDESYLRFRIPGVEGEVGAYVLADGTLDPEDTAAWPKLGGGMMLELALDMKDPALPFRIAPERPPPWRIVWPRGTLEIEAREARGDLLPIESAVLLVDGENLGPVWRDGKPVVVRGIPAGWHTMIVAARGYVAMRYRLRFEDGEARRLRVELGRRTK